MNGAYSLADKEDGSRFPERCMNKCVYTKMGDQDKKQYCFASASQGEAKCSNTRF